MVIAVVLIALFILFYLLKKHIGPTLLAIIAGSAIFEMFGKDISEMICKLINNAPYSIVASCVYVVLVFVLPLILYIRSGHGGLYGLLRVFEALSISALLALLCSSQIATAFPVDELSTNILTGIADAKNFILAGGVAIAYFDILFYHDSK
jgi:hypothetical protein